MTPDTLRLLNEPIYLVIFAQTFCRLSRSNRNVDSNVRIGFVIMAVAALFSILAPYLWGIMPTLPQVAFGAAVLYKQWTTAEAWARQIPPHVMKAPDGSSANFDHTAQSTREDRPIS